MRRSSIAVNNSSNPVVWSPISVASMPTANRFASLFVCFYALCVQVRITSYGSRFSASSCSHCSKVQSRLPGVIDRIFKILCQPWIHVIRDQLLVQVFNSDRNARKLLQQVGSDECAEGRSMPAVPLRVAALLSARQWGYWRGSSAAECSFLASE